jgi:hypothetical protein
MLFFLGMVVAMVGAGALGYYFPAPFGHLLAVVWGLCCAMLVSSTG